MTIRRTFAIEVGRCGFGVSGGLVPELRLGILRVWTCDASVVETLARLRRALAEAAAELRITVPGVRHRNLMRTALRRMLADVERGRLHVHGAQDEALMRDMLLMLDEADTLRRRK